MMIFKKEKQARKLVLGHMSATHDCLAVARGMFEDYVAGETDAAMAKALEIKAHEQDADRLKQEARAVLNEGAFLPHIRADLNRLVEMVDRIAGAGDSAARFLADQTPIIPEEFEAELLEIFGRSVTCFHELRKALKAYVKPSGEIESLHDHVKKVDDLESEIDAKQAKLTRRIFQSEMEFASKLHLQQFLQLIASISDISEEVSDELESVVMGSVV